ncbi:MAG TPA: nitrogen fixation protein NifQ [Rhodocyclaceae bacterium]|nr:nitrogen fixation protein NifQ [Rhodocyclaceae bacterium]
MEPGPRSVHRIALVGDLLARPVASPVAADPLRPVLASLLAGRRLGEGVLDARLGLPAGDWHALRDSHFPGEPLVLPGQALEDIPEHDDLVGLLLDHRAGRSPAESWLAVIVARACAGRDHLWQDLGLADRGELTVLMGEAFPGLAALNTGDMKWKKFIYRHYCSRDGIYVCPAPSCGECADYARCFAPED